MFEYELPDVGEGVAEGEIVAWHVDPGDRVSEDEVLADVETDKAVVDLPSPVDGVVEELHADPGDMVPVGTVVVTIDTDAETAETETAGDAGVPAGGPSDNGAEASEVSTPERRVFAPPNVRRLARELGVDLETVDGSGPSGRVSEDDVRAAAETDTADPDPDPEVTPAGASAGEQTATENESQLTTAVTRREPAETTDGVEPADRDRTLAVPATRGLARDVGVDIDEVPTDATHDGDALVEPEHVRAYAKAQQAAQTADPEAETTTTPSAGAETTTTPSAGAETTTTPSAGAETTTATTGEDSETVSREPYSGVRQTIGNAMAESAFTAPHATHHDTAPAEGLVEARERLKPRAEEAGVHLTYMPFVMKAVAAVLPEYPAMNAQLDEDAGEILYHSRYNIGVAVATDAGLMVPVVEEVDRKGLLEIAAEVTDLVDRARSRELAPAELQGSTFTVTNFGAIGGEYATPILNYPETGILGLGELRQRPVVEDGEVLPKHTLPLSVSIDHRVVDGAVSAGFCNDLKTYLADPTHLLL